MGDRSTRFKSTRDLVGAGRFERPTPCAQGRCATRLRYAPTGEALLILNHFSIEHPFQFSLPAYSTLAPSEYVFHVEARTSHGSWTENGATVRIVILPPWWSTWWFRLAYALAAGLMLWLIWRLRLRQIARQFNMRLEERVGERMRIARELHDTLLQSFQGLMLRFQVAYEELPGRPAEARKALENALDEAARAITEGRDAVQGLRSSTVETNDLARAIGCLGAELAGDDAG
jgi:signal transduction histidine kinase